MEQLYPGVWHDPFSEENNVYRVAGTASEKFLDYRKRFATPLGQAINAWRAWWVTSIVGEDATLLDYGAGVGAFISVMADKCGDLFWAEVNEFMRGDLAFHYLDFREYRPGEDKPDAVTFWDVFEHLSDPWAVLEETGANTAFVTIPYIDEFDEPKNSKHYKPNEHQWYWTRVGFMLDAKAHGWVAEIHSDNPEERTFRREKVASFLLTRYTGGNDG